MAYDLLTYRPVIALRALPLPDALRAIVGSSVVVVRVPTRKGKPQSDFPLPGLVDGNAECFTSIIGSMEYLARSPMAEGLHEDVAIFRVIMLAFPPLHALSPFLGEKVFLP